MNIKTLQASFGSLDHKALTLSDGLNIIEAPNEGGKSTWSAFLRAMLYGIPTRERDKKDHIAEKNRYQPWSGAAMEGSARLLWQGKDITLRRGPKGSTPFGQFEAVYTATGEPVPGLTGDNAGETLLGVPREVFERSAFLGQGRAAIDGVPALEARIAALASSGEEDVSSSQVERRLKDWRNRRKHNKTGLIPQYESELSEVRATLARQAKAHRLCEEARQELDTLDREVQLLQREQAALNARVQAARRAKYAAAQAELDDARAEVEELRNQLTRNGPPPRPERLREAQEKLNELKTLQSTARQLQRQLEETQQSRTATQQATEDPCLGGLDPEAAWEKASADARQADQQPSLTGLRAAGGLALAAGGGLVAATVLKLFPAHLGFALGGVGLLLGAVLLFLAADRKKKTAARRDALLARYSAQETEDILKYANRYLERLAAAQQAAAQWDALQQQLDALTEQERLGAAALLDFVHTFAPEVSDGFGVSAAISRTLGLEEKLKLAFTRMEGAQKLVDGLPPAEEVPAAEEGLTPRYDPAETAARLAAVSGERMRLAKAEALARGERDSLGDPAQLRAREDALTEAIARRTEEYDALTLALDTLAGAGGQLQERFSPVLNRRAGEIFAALTGGRYDKVTLTREFDALGEESGGITPRRALALSQGTADQLYLAVRLAVCELALPAEDPAPLVLDDALVSFDDRRMELALDYLAQEGKHRQILLFTCQGREAAWAAGRSDAAVLRLQS